MAASEPTTVLYAEDDPSLRMIVSFWLEDAGYRVLLAEDGAEALEMVRADHPDLVITDAMMPNMSGDDLVVALKDDPSTAEIPIIMATAAASPLRVERMRARGCFDVLAKPLDETMFLATIRRVLGS